MGSLNFTAYKDRVIVEIYAEGDPYGHEGCDSANCHWISDSHETLYLDIDAAKEIRRKLDGAIKQAQKRPK
jgi:hypothetical protein